MAKKSYNPFKMWGSYVLPIIFVIYYLVGWIARLFFNDKLFCIGTGNEICNVYTGVCTETVRCLINTTTSNIGFFSIDPLAFATILLIPAIIIGFLIGYGIHALIRAIRK